jgi:hypothetical protein
VPVSPEVPACALNEEDQMRRITEVVAVVASFAAASPSAALQESGDQRAPSFAELAVIEYRSAAALAATAVDPQDEDLQPQQDRTFAPGEQFTSAGTRVSRFGEQGTWQFNIFASGTWGESGFDENGDERDVNYYGGGIGVDYFVWEDFSAGAQLVGLRFSQDGPDTAGGAFEIMLRWHVISEDTWSLYLDGGSGFLKSSDDVPPHGSNYNFTPQAGIGFTIEIGGQVRAMSGIRWHHISNAGSADSNPGIDSLMVYTGITVPF